MLIRNEKQRQIWLVRFTVNIKLFSAINSKAIKSLLMGILSSCPLIVFIVQRHESMDPGFLFSYIGVSIWMLIAPYLIMHYDDELLPVFFNKLRNVLKDHELINVLYTKYDNLFSEKFWIVSVPWSLLMTYIVFSNINTPSTFNGVNGIYDFWYWALILIALWAGLMSGIGIWGVLVTMIGICDISRHRLSVDPLMPDKLGGLSCFGYYAIGTTMLLSSGCLMIPYGFQIILDGASSSLYVYIMLLIFTLSILISFLLPTVIINIRAKASRDLLLDDIRKKIALATKDIEMAKTIEPRLAAYLERSTLRDIYIEHKNVRLYPFETTILIKLITSVLLPIAFTYVQEYLIK